MVADLNTRLRTCASGQQCTASASNISTLALSMSSSHSTGSLSQYSSRVMVLWLSGSMRLRLTTESVTQVSYVRKQTVQRLHSSLSAERGFCVATLKHAGCSALCRQRARQKVHGPLVLIVLRSA